MLSRNPESRCVGAVWAVNKPGRDARRLDHGNRPRQKQRTRRRGTADRGVSAVRGGPWPDVPKPERTTRNPPRTGGPVPSRVRHAPRPGRRGHKVHNCQLPAPVPRSLPRRGSARRSPGHELTGSRSRSLFSLDIFIDKPRQARQARPRQHELDGASTARQLDSQGSTSVTCNGYQAVTSRPRVTAQRVRYALISDIPVTEPGDPPEMQSRPL